MATITKNPIAIVGEGLGATYVRTADDIMKNIVNSTIAKQEENRRKYWEELFLRYAEYFDEIGLDTREKQYVWLKGHLAERWKLLGLTEKQFQDYVAAMPGGVVQEINPLVEAGAVKKTPKPPAYPKGSAGGAAGGAPSGTGRRNRKQSNRKTRRSRKSLRRSTRRH